MAFITFKSDINANDDPACQELLGIPTSFPGASIFHLFKQKFSSVVGLMRPHMIPLEQLQRSCRRSANVLQETAHTCGGLVAEWQETSPSRRRGNSASLS